jgi:hypothetical protein
MYDATGYPDIGGQVLDFIELTVGPKAGVVYGNGYRLSSAGRSNSKASVVLRTFQPSCRTKRGPGNPLLLRS